ncbi:uncharacterized protein LOC130401506 [Gadus chalcogrammus]|uniref:uncharacterized protein LOC130401506 n=1 Tax=Gadus chalcogrammus TaxID=1042646 RepID=UPI0024C4BCD1|nr:uncharacterized protein LOC130401506 [Gadus chalcogrammus]
MSGEFVENMDALASYAGLFRPMVTAVARPMWLGSGRRRWELLRQDGDPESSMCWPGTLSPQQHRSQDMSSHGQVSPTLNCSPLPTRSTLPGRPASRGPAGRTSTRSRTRTDGHEACLRQRAAQKDDVSLPTFVKVPGLTWFGRVYVLEAVTRLDETKARVTSIFGDILKMDSTKKIAKKLAGAAAGSAAWMTNVGKEYGQVLVSVLTSAEGEGLTNMAAGLMRRYREAGKAPPRVLYVDRDCCAAVGNSATHGMYHE